MLDLKECDLEYILIRLQYHILIIFHGWSNLRSNKSFVQITVIIQSCKIMIIIIMMKLSISIKNKLSSDTRRYNIIKHNQCGVDLLFLFLAVNNIINEEKISAGLLAFKEKLSISYVCKDHNIVEYVY